MIHTFTDMTIDMVQSTKKNIVNSMVTHDGLNKVLHEFIDKQSTYTKNFIHSLTDTSSAIYAILNNKEFQQETFKNCMMPFGKKGD